MFVTNYHTANIEPTSGILFKTNRIISELKIDLFGLNQVVTSQKGNKFKSENADHHLVKGPGSRL